MCIIGYLAIFYIFVCVVSPFSPLAVDFRSAGLPPRTPASPCIWNLNSLLVAPAAYSTAMIAASTLHLCLRFLAHLSPSCFHVCTVIFGSCFGTVSFPHPESCRGADEMGLSVRNASSHAMDTSVCFKCTQCCKMQTRCSGARQARNTVCSLTRKEFTVGETTGNGKLFNIEITAESIGWCCGF